MTRRVITLRPEMRLVEAAGILLKHSISGAPVVDEDGSLVGLLSEYDCLQSVAAAEYDLDRHDVVVTVAESMVTAMHTISPDTDLFAIAHMFVNLRVRRLPVVDGALALGTWQGIFLWEHRTVGRPRHLVVHVMEA